MATQSRLSVVPEVAPEPSRSGVFRDRIALRSQRADAEFPRALDLEAKVVEALHSRLHGVASLTSGHRSADNWRARLHGEAPVHVSDVCRLATTRTAETQGATFDALVILARAIGCLVSRSDAAAAAPGSPTLGDSAASAAATAVDSLSAYTRALEDGQIDGDELEALQAKAEQLQRASSAFAAAVLVAAGGRS